MSVFLPHGLAAILCDLLIHGREVALQHDQALLQLHGGEGGAACITA